MSYHRILPALLTLAALTVCAGCGDKEPDAPTGDGPAERAGEKVDEAMEKTGEAIDEAVDETGEAMEKTGEKMQD